MKTNETRKRKYSKKNLKEKKFPIFFFINIEKKPYLKKNEVCLLSPNFKLAFK